MNLICGLIGLPSAGKTVILNAITSIGASSYDGSRVNRAIVDVPDPRVIRVRSGKGGVILMILR